MEDEEQTVPEDAGECFERRRQRPQARGECSCGYKSKFIVIMHDFSQTLMVARRQAGLSQADCAHLLGVSRSHISRLEAGKAVPDVADLCGVALIFGRPMEGLSGSLFQEKASEIRERLFDLPEPRKQWLGHFNRDNTLRRLGERIDRIIGAYGS